LVNIIETDDLTRRYGSLTAVDHVAFSVEEGEIFGFLGPNGAGKTTTINMLTTMLKPSDGRATVCGHDISKESSEVRRSIGVVPQEYTADEDLTGYENIILCADLYGINRSVAKERAKELLELVKLEYAKDRKVETYSGGMRRRLELACGLVNHPQLLFLDEPTLGLDVQTRQATWEYIRALKKEYGMSLFMTTHYLEEADNLCDRIAIIDQGKIVRIGTPAELKDSLGGDLIELVVEGGSEIADELKKVPEIIDVKHESNVYRIKAKEGEVIIPSVIEIARRWGDRVLRVSLKKPSLDDAYLEYTGRSIREGEGGSDEVRKQRFTMRRARA
jgi:ABC-2 type transport system ATP-binding protein